MGDAAAVAVVDGADELLEVLSGEVFGEFSFVDFGEEFSSFNVFHDEEDFALGGHDFLEFNDVGMAHQFHDRNLAFDLLHETLFLELLFLDDLDGHVLVGDEVSAVVDLGEVPLPEHPAHLVLVEDYVSGVTLGVFVLRIHGRNGVRSGKQVNWARRGWRF